MTKSTLRGFWRGRQKNQPEHPFPAGRQYALTWTIPADFGGITHALLQRSAAFVSHADTDVEVLTFHHLPDVSAVRRQLFGRGLLSDRVRLRNMWEELAELDDNDIAAFTFDDPRVVTEDFFPIDEVADSAAPVTVTRRDIGHRLEARRYDVRRADGSMLARQDWIGNFTKPAASDRWGDRAVSTTLCDRTGTPVGSWRGAFALYHQWIDRITAGDRSFAIIDVAPVADFMAHYRRPHVKTIMVMHAAHLKRLRLPPYAALSDWRKYPTEQLDHFDATVFLTHRQREDVERLLDVTTDSHVIGNSLQAHAISSEKRDRGHGVAVGRFAVGKRLEHAVRAVDLAHTTHPDLHLHLHGSGEAEAALLRLIDELGADDHVHLEGYANDVGSVFAQASFSLLTSATEGFGLVLIESMGAGCLPIAYDVPYGPAEIITHGVNGFLVSSGDVAALAEQIRALHGMDKTAARTMREAAIARAADFEPGAITNLWGDALRSADQTPAPIGPPDQETLVREERQAGRIRVESAAVRVELLAARWERDEVLRLALRAELNMNAEAAGAAVSADLIHIASGRRTRLETEPHNNVTNSDGVVDFGVSIDARPLLGLHEPGWVLMVGIERDGIRYEDTVRSRKATGLLAPLPLTAFGPAGRITCHVEPGWGVVLRKPSPRVGAVGTVNGRQVELEMSHLSGHRVDGVVATSALTGEVVEASSSTPETWVLGIPDDPFLQEQRWDLLAVCSDGKRRKISWFATGDELAEHSPRHAPVALEVTAYGYLGVSAQSLRTHAVDMSIGDGAMVVTLAATSFSAQSVAFALSGDGGRADPLVADPSNHRLVFDVESLAPGAYGLRASNDDFSHSVSISGTTAVQHLLPINGPGGVTVTRTRGTGAIRVTKVDSSH